MTPSPSPRRFRSRFLAAGLVAAGLLPLALELAGAPARADDAAKIDARIGAWGRNGKNAIAEKYKARSMADVEVSLGETTLAEIQRSGLSYTFRVRNLPGKDPQGYCNTDGQGNVQEIHNMNTRN
ncbi:MAG: hypothetical protein VKK97_05110 [Synechococcaceae cyanobacterium]|nr:hypothetical protein [Synechococcaceae cyanobacterium]